MDSYQPSNDPSLGETAWFWSLDRTEIPVWKIWTPFGIAESTINPWVNDYRTLAKNKAANALK